MIDMPNREASTSVLINEHVSTLRAMAPGSQGGGATAWWDHVERCQRRVAAPRRTGYACGAAPRSGAAVILRVSAHP